MSVELRENKGPYTKSFTSFSGADMIPVLDGNVAGELSSITWEKNVESFMHGGSTSSNEKVRGTMTATVFTRNPLQELEGKKFDILCYYANEYGQSMLEFVKGARLTKAVGGISVDSIISEVGYEYVAEDFIVVPEPDFKDHQEQLEFILQNDGKRDQQLEVDAYKALMRWNLERRAFIVIDPNDLAKLAKEQEEWKRETAESFAEQKAALRAKAEAEKAEAAQSDFKELSKAIMEHMMSGKAF